MAEAKESPQVRVVAAVARRDNSLLICRRPPTKRHGDLWEFPGGKCEIGESDFDAMSRELSEELGVTVTSIGEEVFSIADPGSPYLIVFREVEFVGEPLCHEHSELRWASVREIASLPLAPSDKTFVDSLTLR